MTTEIKGRSWIGQQRGSETNDTFRAFAPVTGEPVEPAFHSATIDELGRACELADKARLPFGNMNAAARAGFLRSVADNIEALGDALLERASLETGLPVDRFAGERARTCNQLRMFADLLEEGSWVDARIDHAIPDRKPIPKPDVRSMLRPLGPVAVFCASNFPLAYSVAGGDTASAFAAGCPVIVNAHTAHPGTAEVVANAIAAAVKEHNLPEGTFSLIFSSRYELGQALVKHQAIKAVGFTGSRAGGRAIMDIAAARPEPIPVYTEMSSVNPTFILPSAIRERGAQIVAGLHASVTGGAGQFCTKPGLVFVPEESDKFKSEFRDLISSTPASPLLTGGIRNAYNKGNDARAEYGSGLEAEGSDELNGFAVRASVFETTADQFLEDRDLEQEVFGPTTLLITSDSHEKLLDIAHSLEGQLTASIHGTEDDLKEYADLVEILETKAGRLIFNGFSTGVEVCPSIVHGGPYPATSDSRSTAVGTRAITRWTRLVCYQNFPDAALPEELRESNPVSIWRMVDSEMTRDGIA